MADLIGRQLSGYRIEAELGRGGQGVVYLATQVRLRRMVALKVVFPQLSADEGFRERFELEGVSAARLDHPHVIPVYEAGESEGLAFLAMKFVDGPTVEELIRSRGGLPVARSLRILDQVASALDFAHERGLVHRDVKAANVLLGAGDWVYLTDFGLTKALEAPGISGPGLWMGTLEYVAPEQLLGRGVGPEADRYALASLAYELLTGRLPYRQKDRSALMYSKLNEQPQAPSSLVEGLPESVDRVIFRGMAIAPEARYESSIAFVEALSHALDTSVPEPSAERPLTPTAPSAIPTGMALPSQDTTGADMDGDPASPPPHSRPATAPQTGSKRPQELRDGPPRATQAPAGPIGEDDVGGRRGGGLRWGSAVRRPWLVAGAGAAAGAAVILGVITLGGGNGETRTTSGPAPPATGPSGEGAGDPTHARTAPILLPATLEHGWTVLATRNRPINVSLPTGRVQEVAQALRGSEVGLVVVLQRGNGVPVSVDLNALSPPGEAAERLALPGGLSGRLFESGGGAEAVFAAGGRDFLIVSPTRATTKALAEAVVESI